MVHYVGLVNPLAIIPHINLNFITLFGSMKTIPTISHMGLWHCFNHIKYCGWLRNPAPPPWMVEIAKNGMFTSVFNW